MSAAAKKKSTIAQLEDCLHNTFLVQDAEKVLDIPEVREAIGYNIVLLLFNCKIIFSRFTA